MMNQDNAKTAFRTRRMPFRPPQSHAPEQSVNILPIGTYLGEFEIIDLIGEGGFGIVYLAYDHSLERQVALKEYMPSGLATRTNQMSVTVRSQHNLDTFTAGLKSFINEAKMLAQFDSPALVKVHLFWEGNGTAYMVMPYYEGVTLKQALKEHRINPGESWIRLLLADLFDAIDIIHRMQCLHRDIAPDNILLLKDGRPLLLDFGAARRVIGDLTQCLTAILKPGFAPIEQYADIAGLRQGPWTDIYALAAVVYYLITGKAPPPAVARLVHDELVPAREAGKGRYSDAFLSALDKALAVKPEQRFQSIAELRRALNITETVPRTLPRSHSDWPATLASTAPLEEPVTEVKPDFEPPINPKLEPRLAPARQSAARADVPPPKSPEVKPSPEADRRRAPGSEIKPNPGPEVKVAAKPAVKPDMQSITQMAENWQIPHGIEQSSAGRTRPDKRGWLILALLFSVGIGSGIYLGSNRTWDGLSGRSVASSRDSGPPAADVPASFSSAGASESAGASGTGDVAAADTSSLADATTLPSPPPAIENTLPAAPHLPSEIELWRRASASDKASTYENYLRQYPAGSYAVIARLRLERLQADATKLPPAIVLPSQAQLEKSRRVPSATIPKTAALSPEEESWTRTTTIDNAPAYQEYLEKYPKGGYAALAKDRLAKYQPAQIDPVAPPSTAIIPQVAEALAPERKPAEGVNKQAGIPPQEPIAASASKLPDVATPEPTSDETSKQASRKPAEPDVLAAAKKMPDALAQTHSAAPLAGGSTTLKLNDQTMTGNFSVDPLTGAVSGLVKINWVNGDQFEGRLVRGLKEGKGKFIWSNGQRYSGDWARDVPNGKGVIHFTDGSRYEGDVRDGVPHGRGMTRFKGGDVYNGEWIKGKSNGQGRYVWANGSYWEGEFRDDKRTDNGKMVYHDAKPHATASAPASATGIVPDAEPPAVANQGGSAK